jgi:Iodothyronine deiodinase
VPALNKLHHEYEDRAAFYIVYIQEAHPIDGWQMKVNEEEDVLVSSTHTVGERSEIAGTCVRDLGIEFPALIDETDDKVERAYTGWPDRLYVIDRDGRVAYKSGPGPFGFKPAEVEVALKQLLPDSSLTPQQMAP